MAEQRGPANRLIKESSPYLLQHAYNPVDWYPWGEEAFDEAKKKDKPVLVSIGYAACHWCHVMERESFEDPQVAAIMNEHFVNIKVDREERPDVDHIYMDAVQAIAGNGGWPLNVFLTADKKPFYGGTYFPPRRAYNRASWAEVLVAVSDAYKNRRSDMLQQAENLTAHIRSAGVLALSSAGDFIKKEQIDLAFENLMKAADREWGGFGQAPKFPQTFSIQFLLIYAYKTGNDEAIKQALLSLDKMIRGGIYDHIGGGFARYSTDREWLVPHFEKMLYDNALLVSTLADAYRLTKKPLYKETLEETMVFVERELTHESGGFFSALDADSEGEEGKFYVWNHHEVAEVLGKDAEIFCDFYDIRPGGNWEGNSIPRITLPLEEFAAKYELDDGELEGLLKDCRNKLLEHRGRRIRPQLDDKVLLSWNALMNIAYSKAYAATSSEHYRHIAEENMNFMLRAFGSDVENLHHSWKNDIARHPAFLDDYAYLASALIELAEVSSDFSYLNKARELTDVVLEQFADPNSPFFFYTREQQKDVPLRKKEIYDGATPSGNAVMASNLYRLSVFFDIADWRERAAALIENTGELAVKYPTSFGVWLSLLYEMTCGSFEIGITGPDSKSFLKEIQALFIPHKMIMASEDIDNQFPILAGKPADGENHIYLCKNYSCQNPVSTVADFVKLLKL